MIIPKHLKRPGMTAEETKNLKKWIAEKRKIMRNAPSFATVQEATDAAVKTAKTDKDSIPTVWKEPLDIGRKYAVVHFDDRENAYISGYTEVVDEQQVFDKANHIDEIKEV